MIFDSSLIRTVAMDLWRNNWQIFDYFLCTIPLITLHLNEAKGEHLHADSYKFKVTEFLFQKSQKLRIFILIILLRSSYEIKKYKCNYFSLSEKTSCCQGKIRSPEHCLKLESWRGPPHRNKFKQYEIVLSFKVSLFIQS